MSFLDILLTVIRKYFFTDVGDDLFSASACSRASNSIRIAVSRINFLRAIGSSSHSNQSFYFQDAI